MAKHLFTSESVTEGHPDKICDNISDAVLDAILAQDPDGRVACETTCITDQIMVMGEITTKAKIDIEKIARDVVCEIGYDSPEKGFDGHTCKVQIAIDKQSPDIALGVDKSYELKEGYDDSYNLHGAGDQGMMFGYACDETEELMPLSISLSHKLAKQLTNVRKDGTLPYLRPDGKTQVTVEYDESGAPKRVDTIVISSQHSADVSLDQIRSDIVKYVIKPIVPENLLDDDTIIYDTYGGIGRHGGGCFSGKDPTKVDRSAAYAARYVAKNIVAAGLAKKCEIQIAYAIGVAHPVSVMIDTFGTGIISDDTLSEIVTETFDLRPAAIIDSLNLRRPIYRQLAAYGHMGRTDLDLPWEKTDKAVELKQAAGI